MRIRFLLVCEGSSDDALVAHISKLLIEHGVTEAGGVPYHRIPSEVTQGQETYLAAKVEQGLKLFGAPDLLPDLLFHPSRCRSLS